ncbi:MAG: aldo/keto reductase, partial [Bacteroidales bacterium]|nr:aldo/keto reductase [Bacteroidales bacterium]
ITFFSFFFVLFCICDIKFVLVVYCYQNGILVEGYSPNATGQLLQKAELQPIAAKYGVSVAQIAIRYVLQKNVLPLPKSVHEEFIVANSQIDFEITKDDMAILDLMVG